MSAYPASGLPTVALGPGLDSSLLGIGCMGMAEFYGPTSEDESIATIHAALDHGVTLIDTAYMYGAGRSEEIVGAALAGRPRDEVRVATKCGLIRTADDVVINGRPDHIRVAIDESLRRLRLDHIDLYYLHRVDPAVPVEESIGAMAELVAAGKVRHLGISEASGDSIRRAHRTHPMNAVQSEYSLATREPESDQIPVCRELGIAFVAWGPLSRGLLTGTIREANFGPDDLRGILPRFGREALAANLTVVDRLGAIAAEVGCGRAQLALAWLIAQGAVPIPGAMTVAQLVDNVGAARIILTPEVMAAIDAAAPVGALRGHRFHAPMAAAVNR
jgi:aryl-alcohol dehydrogenase-like predicted oxidoreductase